MTLQDQRTLMPLVKPAGTPPAASATTSIQLCSLRQVTGADDRGIEDDFLDYLDGDEGDDEDEPKDDDDDDE